MTSKYVQPDGSVRLSMISEGPYLKIDNKCLTKAGVLPGELAQITVRRLHNDQ